MSLALYMVPLAVALAKTLYVPAGAGTLIGGGGGGELITLPPPHPATSSNNTMTQQPNAHCNPAETRRAAR